jgi:prepilin-type N-terminal cleavage/methylation domain-containing protein/prepilin-type processing-associated H-X9-DG protein
MGMRIRNRTPGREGGLRRAFTLIELLVVVAILSLLMAILMPSLRRTRALARRTVCAGNLSQIGKGWELYWQANADSFPKYVNAQYRFGGWTGELCKLMRWDPYRPISKSMGLDPNGVVHKPDGARVFCCPADRGGIPNRPLQKRAFDWFGNSYYTNIYLVGPAKLNESNDRTRRLHEKIGQMVESTRRSDVSNVPSKVIFLGDNTWHYQWDFTDAREEILREQAGWHGRRDYFNILFLDGHVGFTRIYKDVYLSSEFDVLPFQIGNELAREIQSPISGN